MIQFTYKAIPAAQGGGGSASSVIDGRLEAPDERSLRDKLRAQGMIVLEARPVSAMDAIRASLGGRGLRANDAVWFFQTLEQLMDAKVPVESAISTMQELAPRPRLVEACREVGESLRAGVSLSDAVAKVDRLARPQHIALLRVGHESGRLAHVIRLISRSIEAREKIRRTVTGRMIYPALVIVVTILAVWILATFVIPRFAETLSAAGVELPLSTRITMAAADWAAWIGPAMLVVLLGVIGLRSKALPESTRLKLDRLVLRIPILGSVIWNTQGALVSETLATIVEGGGDVLSGLEQAESALRSPELRGRLGRAREQVRAGEELGEAIAREQVIPPMASAIVRAGMKAGDLVGALKRASEMCVRRQDELTGRLLTLLEPAVTLFIAGIVAWVFYSLIAGILTMNDLGAL